MKGFGNRNGALLVAAAMAMTGGFGLESDIPSRYTMPKQEPYSRGRRAEKDAAAQAKAEEKRRRKAAKRLGHNK